MATRRERENAPGWRRKEERGSAAGSPEPIRVVVRSTSQLSRDACSVSGFLAAWAGLRGLPAFLR
jgi:hypothetical protein